jgi:translation initiation factor 3 subunit F
MSSLSVKIHPVVLFNIINAFERRNQDQSRVIGTLLGSHDKLGNVDITNSFVVQHREANGEVAIDIEVAKELFELYRKVNSNENIVGWFSTGGGEVNEYSVVIHDYYSRETTTPVHVTVDPTESGVSVKAFVSTPFGVPNKCMGTMFSPVPCLSTASGYETEMVGLRACMAASGITNRKPASFESEVDMIFSAAQKCSDNIGAIIQFIDEHILSGKAVPGNSNEIGRELMAMIESVVPFGDNEDDALNTNLKDLLMVIYLANLSKTQLMLNEKISLLLQ